MSASSAPTYYFSGISFNSAFYIPTSTTGITVSQANLLYLQKTTPDTASAVETFSGGIVTGVIDSPGSIIPINIGTSNGAPNVIGTTSSQTTIYGTAVINNTLNSSNILPLTSGGAFSMCSNNGTLNIATGALRTQPININTSATSTATLNLGSASSTTNCNSDLTMANGKNITLQNALTGYVAPTVAQLGGFISVPFSNTVGAAFVSNVNQIYGTYTLTQAGYYLMVANCINYSTSLLAPYVQCTIYDTTNSKYVAYYAILSGTTNNTLSYSVSGFYRVPASTSTVIQLRVNINFASGSATVQSDVYNFSIIRIA